MNSMKFFLPERVFWSKTRAETLPNIASCRSGQESPKLYSHVITQHLSHDARNIFSLARLALGLSVFENESSILYIGLGFKYSMGIFSREIDYCFHELAEGQTILDATMVITKKTKLAVDTNRD